MVIIPYPIVNLMKFYLGTFPERSGDKLYNTCLAYGPQGELLAKHRKV